jgi:hypothetical protein
MRSNTVDRAKRLDQVVSVRMSQREFKHLKETLKNYQLHKKGVSAQLRVLLSWELYRSRKYVRVQKELKKKAILVNVE